MEKTYNISAKSNKESNEFLRCLWSRIRAEFGKLAWNLSPIRLGKSQTILIGFADMGNVSRKFEPTSISCTYSKKGCLKSISWANNELINPQQFEDKFDKCIKEAGDYPNYKKSFFLQHNLDKNITFKFYKGRNFSLSGDLLVFEIKAYDSQDHNTFAQNTVKMIREYLSFDTLKFISSSNSGIENLRSKNDHTYVLTDIDTGEATSSISVNGKFKNLEISQFIISKIELFLDRDLDYENPYSLFEKSIMAFSQALFFEEMKNSQFYLDFSPSEYSALGYMSALEIITFNDIIPTKCKECGQDKYSIAKRVIALSEQATNNEYLKKLISRFYSVRSKFVHAGEYLSSNNYIGTSIPLLSSTSTNGIIDQSYHYDTTIKELVKECIIWHENNNNKANT